VCFAHRLRLRVGAPSTHTARVLWGMYSHDCRPNLQKADDGASDAACDVSLTLVLGHGPQPVQVRWPGHMPGPGHIHAHGNLHARRRRRPRFVWRSGGENDAAIHLRHESWRAGCKRSHVLQRWVRIARKSAAHMYIYIRCFIHMHVYMYVPIFVRERVCVRAYPMTAGL
jgi:hypothetical protein